jgi:hypothetical protein
MEDVSEQNIGTIFWGQAVFPEVRKLFYYIAVEGM